MTTLHCLAGQTAWAASQVSRPGVNPGKAIVQTPSGGFGHGNIRGRCIYIPSTNALASEINAAGIATSAADFLADGWQVISFDNFACQTPLAGSTPPNILGDANDATGNSGGRLAATQMFYLYHQFLWANKTQGGAIPTFLAGYSWGAWPAAWACLTANFTPPAGSPLIGAISRCPPYQWENTPGQPEFSGGSFSNMDFTATMFNAVTIPVHFSASSNDTLTQPASIQTMANNAIAVPNSNVTLTYDSSDDHGWFASEITDFNSWVTATLDPSYPPTY